MFAYIIRRLILAVVILFCVATLIFSALYTVPGDPAEILLATGGVEPPAEAVTALRERMGLDDPIWAQYLEFLRERITLDLGRSLIDNTPVAREIALRLPRTLELVFFAVVFGVAIGLPLGIAAAYRQNTVFDRIILIFSSVFISVPVFVIGTLLILFFAQRLGWFPSGGYVRPDRDLVGHFTALLLPSLSLGLGLVAVVMRMSRTTVLEVMGQDWVRTAHAKGLPEGRVRRMHVVRNALGPIVTLIGLNAGAMLGGTVLVEYVFGYPGLSSLLVQAVDQRDYPIVQGVVLTVCTCFVLINLIVDILYGVLDPRIRG